MGTPGGYNAERTEGLGTADLLPAPTALVCERKLVRTLWAGNAGGILATAYWGSQEGDPDRSTTLTGHTAQTGDAYARLGAPAGASVSADVAAVKAQTAAIETDTQDLQTQIGTDGAGLTNMPWNAAWDAQVESEVTDALNAYDPPTNAEMVARTLARCVLLRPGCGHCSQRNDCSHDDEPDQPTGRGGA